MIYLPTPPPKKKKINMFLEKMEPFQEGKNVVSLLVPIYF